MCYDYYEERKALALHLKVDVEDIRVYNDYYEANGEEWLVYDNSEADEAVKEYVMDNVWCFTPSFLENYIPLDTKSISKLQELCEDCNDAILRLLGNDFEDFVEDAISCDGRGHFLACYDGEEHVIEIGEKPFPNEYYLYRTN